MKKILLSLALLLSAVFCLSPNYSFAQEEDTLTKDENNFLQSLHPQHGNIVLQGAPATISLGEKYVFYGPEDAKKILVEAWGNKPEAADGVIGMIALADKNIYNSWGAAISYDPQGYVSDKDAKTQDYNKVLADMKEEDKINATADDFKLVGWATPPTYNEQKKYLVWATELSPPEGDKVVNSLNYDVRNLGRSGILSLNMIDYITNLDIVKVDAVELAETVKFNAGETYADHKFWDKKSELGLAGLVAAGAGVVVAKKLGLFAIIAAFGKKLIILIGALFAASFKYLKRFFGGAKNDDVINQTPPDDNNKS